MEGTTPFAAAPAGRAGTTTIGVTGTKGKTSTSYFLWQLLEVAQRSAVATTEGTRVTRHRVFEPCHTADDLQHLAVLCEHDGVRYVVVELTSFALSRDVHRATSPTGAVLTNIGHDHIVQHGNMRNYVFAKRKLFRDIHLTAQGNEPWAVLNADDACYDSFAAVLHPSVRLWSYAIGRRPDTPRSSMRLWAEAMEHHRWGTSWVLHGLPDGPLPCRTPLHGAFNVSNLLAAIGAAIAAGISCDRIVRAAEALVPPLGRFEVVDPGGSAGPAVIVDFAHTSESLDAVLRAARCLRPEGRVVVVFGIGADRYTPKRAQMGRVAAALADRVVITTDNPEMSDPREIAVAIARGVPRADRSRTTIELDRREAIDSAIAEAGVGDVVVIAGMGPQQAINVGGELHRHCDVSVAADALRRRAPSVRDDTVARS